MFGLTEITALLDEPVKLAIIPTVVLPFTILGMILTSIATWIAALFGVELKAEGPKRLFEVLVKPRVLFWALVSNFIVYFAIQGGLFLYNKSYPLWWVKVQNSRAKASAFDYPGAESLVLKPELAEEESTEESQKNLTLELVWETNTKGVAFGPPIISTQSLLVGKSTGKLYELDLKDGKEVRHFDVGKAIMTSPILWEDKVFVGEGVHETHHARLYSFNLKTGEFEKAFETKGHIERAAKFTTADSRSLLLVPAGKDGLYAVDAQTMEKVWQAPIGHIDTTPGVDSERVYTGTGLEAGFAETATKAFALDLTTGKVVWEKELPISVWGVPVLWKNIVCFGVGDVYKNTHYGQLACYNSKTGEDYFAFNTAGALIGEPVIIGDNLITSDFHGKIYQFNLKNRTLDWTLQVPVKNFSYPSVVLDSQDRLILPGRDGVYVYSRKDRKLITTWKPSDEWKGSLTNVVIRKDMWYLADARGSIYALKAK